MGDGRWLVVPGCGPSPRRFSGGRGCCRFLWRRGLDASGGPGLRRGDEGWGGAGRSRSDALPSVDSRFRGNDDGGSGGSGGGWPSVGHPRIGPPPRVAPLLVASAEAGAAAGSCGGGVSMTLAAPAFAGATRGVAGCAGMMRPEWCAVPQGRRSGMTAWGDGGCRWSLDIGRSLAVMPAQAGISRVSRDGAEKKAPDDGVGRRGCRGSLLRSRPSPG